MTVTFRGTSMRKILSALLVALPLLFISCGSALSDSGLPADEAVLVFSDRFSGRTVFPTFSGDGLTDIVLTAGHDGTSSKIAGWESLTEFSGASAEIAAGTYTFTLSARTGSENFSSVLKDRTVVAGKENLLEFTLLPEMNGGGNGSLSLTVRTSQPVRMESAELTLIACGEDKNTEPVRVSAESIAGDGRSLVFRKDGIPSGIYKADFSAAGLCSPENGDGYSVRARYALAVWISAGLTSSAEITVGTFNRVYKIEYNDGISGADAASERVSDYTIDEDVELPVLPGSDHLIFGGWYDNDGFSGTSLKNISAWSRAENLVLYAKWNQDTDYVFYNNYSSASTDSSDASLAYGLFSAATPDGERKPEYEVDGLPSNSTLLDFCFDASGNLAWLYADAQSNNSLCINKTGSSYTVSLTSGTAAPKTAHLRCDPATGKFYLLAGGAELYVLSFSDGGVCSAEKLDSGQENISDVTAFAAYKDRIYLSGQRNDENQKKIIFLSAFSVEGTELTEYGTAFTETESTDCKVSDILVQDGALYVLVRETKVEKLATATATTEVFSRGGIYRFTMTDSGFAMDDEFGFKGWTDGGYPMKVTDGIEYTANIYMPSSVDSADGLFGPERFVAIKPKKLVFSDSGLFVYKDDSVPNKFRWSKVARLVEFDLESRILEVRNTLSQDKELSAEWNVVNWQTKITDTGTCVFTRKDITG